MNRIRIIRLIVLFTLVFILHGCVRDENDLLLTLEAVEENFSLYRLHPPKGDDFAIMLNNDGKITGFGIGRPGRVQRISINDSTGNVLAIQTYNQAEKLHGRCYYFYKESGFLEGDINYVNGVKVGNAVIYHDSTALVKSTMLYNDEGQLYFRITYDIDGNIISKEGNDGSEKED